MQLHSENGGNKLSWFGVMFRRVPEWPGITYFPLPSEQLAAFDLDFSVLRLNRWLRIIDMLSVPNER